MHLKRQRPYVHIVYRTLSSRVKMAEEEEEGHPKNPPVVFSSDRGKSNAVGGAGEGGREEEAAIKHSRRRWLVYEQKEGGGVRDHGGTKKKKGKRRRRGAHKIGSPTEDQKEEGFPFYFPSLLLLLPNEYNKPWRERGSERGCGMGEEKRS